MHEASDNIMVVTFSYILWNDDDDDKMETDYDELVDLSANILQQTS